MPLHEQEVFAAAGNVMRAGFGQPQQQHWSAEDWAAWHQGRSSQRSDDGEASDVGELDGKQDKDEPKAEHRGRSRSRRRRSDDS